MNEWLQLKLVNLWLRNLIFIFARRIPKLIRKANIHVKFRRFAMFKSRFMIYLPTFLSSFKHVLNSRRLPVSLSDQRQFLLRLWRLYPYCNLVSDPWSVDLHERFSLRVFPTHQACFLAHWAHAVWIREGSVFDSGAIHQCHEQDHMTALNLSLTWALKSSTWLL